MSNKLFKFYENSNICSECQINENGGYQCFGDRINVKLGNWIAVKKSKNSKNLNIIQSLCPPHVCCDQKNGCNLTKFTEKSDSDMLCAQNRYPTTPLCGSCLKGFSEAYGTYQCQKCENNYGILMVLVIFGILFAFGLSFVKNINNDNNFR